MDPAVVKKTQETLGKVIKKPQLSEKYLSKPPFRFLHDIFTEVIRTTGFMKGLYSDTDMKSENIKEREAKMAFLQKAVDVVVLVTGEPLCVKPARVVAGQEAEKTNELLQAVALCCLNKRSSEDAVRRVLSADKPPPKPQERGERGEDKGEEPRGAEGKSRRTKPEESRERHKNEEPEQRHRGQKERERREKRGEERERKERERGEERERKEKREERERREEKEKREEREKSKEKTRSTDRERERDKHRDKERERERRRRERDQDRTRSKPREDDPQTQEKSEEPPQNISPEEPPRPMAESSARIPRPSSAKGQRRRAKVGSQDESDSEGDAEAAQKVPQSSTEAAAVAEAPPTGAPPTGAPPTEAAPSRRTVRPSSARPVPPRAKRQDSHAETESSSSAKVSALILDGRKTEEEENDEDKQFLVQEALAAAAEAPDAHTESTEAEGGAAHGGLVKKILETKKYYEVSPSATKAQASVQRKEQDLVQREMERLRSSVQTVCRSALPLGKIMDYIQEDMDAMSAELQQWRQENQEHARALQEETRLTEGALLPLRTELSELESLIQEQQSQICVLRCSVLKNDERIHKMLTGLHRPT